MTTNEMTTSETNKMSEKKYQTSGCACGRAPRALARIPMPGRPIASSPHGSLTAPPPHRPIAPTPQRQWVTRGRVCLLRYRVLSCHSGTRRPHRLLERDECRPASARESGDGPRGHGKVGLARGSDRLASRMHISRDLRVMRLLPHSWEIGSRMHISRNLRVMRRSPHSWEI